MDDSRENGPAKAYLGQLAKDSRQVVLIAGDDFLDVTDGCDAFGQPDEGSFEALRDPMVLRFKAKLVLEPDLAQDGEEVNFTERVQLSRHPKGSLVLAGRDLARIQERVRTGASTITGDVLRSFAPTCQKCSYKHHDWQDCKAFLEPSNRFGIYLGYLDGDPEEVFAVAGPHDEDYEQATAIAAVAGREPRIIKEVSPGVLFLLRVLEDGSVQVDPKCCCYYQDAEWLEALFDLLVADSED